MIRMELVLVFIAHLRALSCKFVKSMHGHDAKLGRHSTKRVKLTDQAAHISESML